MCVCVCVRRNYSLGALQLTMTMDGNMNTNIDYRALRVYYTCLVQHLVIRKIP